MKPDEKGRQLVRRHSSGSAGKLNISVDRETDVEVEFQAVGFTPRGREMSGVSTPRAETAATRAGGLVVAIGPDAEPASGPTSHGHFDVCPTWLELAIRHLSDAQVARAARIQTWKDTDDHSKTGALEWEFGASIQAIMASAIALEAFCAAVQTTVHLPQALIDEWRDKRTPRYIQISEVLRRAFSLEPKNVSSLRQTLAEIFRFRDLAIDPSGKSNVQILHPELGVGVEWRFAYFRCENALLIVKATLRLIAELAAAGKPKDADLQKYIDALRSSVEPLRNAMLATLMSGSTNRTQKS
jgi:hypothetical protein